LVTSGPMLRRHRKGSSMSSSSPRDAVRAVHELDPRTAPPPEGLRLKGSSPCEAVRAVDARTAFPPEGLRFTKDCDPDLGWLGGRAMCVPSACTRGSLRHFALAITPWRARSVFSCSFPPTLREQLWCKGIVAPHHALTYAKYPPPSCFFPPT